MINNIGALSLVQLRKALNNNEITPLDVVSHYIGMVEKYDKDVRSFLYVNKEQALQAAKAVQNDGLLSGIPIGLKDCFVTKDMPTTCGAKMLDGFISPFNATVVDKINASGGVILGKLNLDQFSMGGTGETSYFRRTLNPWNKERIPGGSSAGSAAAVAAGFAPVALGTDAGGSVRQPASFCGVTGFKPTYGAISRNGAIAFASSMDTVGIFAKSVEDVAFMMDAVAGKDEKDMTSHSLSGKDFLAGLSGNIKGLRIGIPQKLLGAGLNSDVRASFEAALTELKKLGAELVDIDIDYIEYAESVYKIVSWAEGSSNMSRFDGVRFGVRADGASYEEQFANSRGDGFGNEVIKRILFGTYVLQSGQYNDYYVQATKVRRLISEAYKKAFGMCDVILMPTTPNTARGFNVKQRDAKEAALEEIYNCALNLYGGCGLSVPMGLDSNGLPMGLQLQGAMFNDSVVLNAGHAFQSVTEWHKLAPLFSR